MRRRAQGPGGPPHRPGQGHGARRLTPPFRSRRRDRNGPLVPAVGEGRLVHAAEILCALLADDQELAALAAAGAFEEYAPFLPVQLREVEQGARPREPGPTDPSVPARNTAPTLFLRGTDPAPAPWFDAGARHVTAHVAAATAAEAEGAGHFGAAPAPEAVAEALVRFLHAVPD
ncbi:hypothetical protein NE857_20200 [Nocardiopsis exhalans]|uniref:Alpha/beta hydrolase n=1 Tax=Nocardiopsis exhalans TaxID=163604 RepID=A0ABY5D085_9ACTN|nr:hypothetical protein [Nocardiopsis exhalans]USY17656.1 hypothetical protein NE857_20200 [Nocardiopsis exhalans]